MCDIKNAEVIKTINLNGIELFRFNGVMISLNAFFIMLKNSRCEVLSIEDDTEEVK